MKKGTSISLVILILTGMLHLTVANHYCGGKIAASKVSSSGQLANCGMEGTDKQVPPAGYPFSPVSISESINKNVSPSGEVMSAHVDLSDICVFRI
jgi:hypothetical protein